MKRVDASEIRPLDDYELARESLRARVLDIKAARRVHVGDALTLLFENHDTVLYQIQEMLRVERICEPRAIRHEIETYNELIGGPNELRATLLIEYADKTEREHKLRELSGLQNHVHLVVGKAEPCTASFDLRQMNDERISSVHYLRFVLGAERAEAIRQGAPVRIVVDHPHLSAMAELSAQQRAALADDLAN